VNDFYQEMRGVAQNVLRDFDQREGDGSAQTDGLWYIGMTPGAGPADEPGAPTPVPFKLEGAARGVAFKFIGSPGANGTTIVATDMQCTVAAKDGFEPTMTGFIDMDGVRHKIMSIVNLPPVGVTVAHTLIFRK
jgi:hypothetical protein